MSIRREVAAGSLKTTKRNNRYYVTAFDFENWNNLANTHKQESSCVRIQVDNVNWISVSDDMNTIDCWENPAKVEDFNYIDLFAGAGGLSCGLLMAGFNPVGSVEIMEPAVATYKRNFSRVFGFSENIQARDISLMVVKQALIESVQDRHIHLIAGGFPCQGFSMAGHRIIDDERNSLYREMLSIVEEIRPDFVLMENVEGLRSMLGGKVEQKILEDYASIGYQINVTVLNAADYGVPQMRKRVIFIGNKIGAINCHPAHTVEPANYKTVRDGIERFSSMPENKAINHIFTRHSADIAERLNRLPQGQSLYENYSDAWKRVYWDMPSSTVKENHGGVNVHPLLPRVMTPRELAALQSFPDDFIFEGSKKWQLVQIGNAVPPLLGKAIGLAIKKSLKGETQDITVQALPPECQQLNMFGE
jgi:DNA (cytosine-5)-methyltransferase 1